MNAMAQQTRRRFMQLIAAACAAVVAPFTPKAWTRTHTTMPAMTDPAVNPDEVFALKYPDEFIVMGVDWAGCKGYDDVPEEERGLELPRPGYPFGKAWDTTVCVVAVSTRDASVRVLDAVTISHEIPHAEQVLTVLSIARRNKASVIAHDQVGAGCLWGLFLLQAGWPAERVMGLRDVRTIDERSVIAFVRASDVNRSPYPLYNVDKERSDLVVRFAIYDARKNTPNCDKPIPAATRYAYVAGWHAAGVWPVLARRDWT